MLGKQKIPNSAHVPTTLTLLNQALQDEKGLQCSLELVLRRRSSGTATKITKCSLPEVLSYWKILHHVQGKLLRKNIIKVVHIRQRILQILAQHTLLKFADKFCLAPLPPLPLIFCRPNGAN